MRTTQSLLVFLICSLSVGCSREIGVTDVQFGSFAGVGTNNLVFRAERTLTKAREVNFGWAFSMANPPEKLTLREVVTGPDGVIWVASSDSSGIEVSDGGKTVSVTKTISKPNSPFLFHHWSISPADPAGMYRATLYIEGQVAREISFVVSN